PRRSRTRSGSRHWCATSRSRRRCGTRTSRGRVRRWRSPRRSPCHPARRRARSPTACTRSTTRAGTRDGGSRPRTTGRVSRDRLSGSGNVSVMEIVHGVLLVLHLIGWAIVLGGVVASMRSRTVPAGAWHGILTALVTGVLMVGVLEMGDDHVNSVKIGVKLLVAIVVAVLVWRGRKQEEVTNGYLGAIAGLVALNVALAVLWR